MTPRPMYMQIPVEEYESLNVAIETMAAELKELRKHEVEWDLDKARVKELEAENESLKYSVATIDTDLTMLKRWRKVSEELPEDWDCVIAICQDGTYAMPIYSVANGWDIDCNIEGKYYRTDEIKYWMPLPEPPEVK